MHVIIEIDDVGTEDPKNIDDWEIAPTACKVRSDGACGGLY
jgi:hypothetical protein